jgi:hypothetical protein
VQRLGEHREEQHEQGSDEGTSDEGGHSRQRVRPRRQGRCVHDARVVPSRARSGHGATPVEGLLQLGQLHLALRLDAGARADQRCDRGLDAGHVLLHLRDHGGGLRRRVRLALVDVGLRDDVGQRLCRAGAVGFRSDVDEVTAHGVRHGHRAAQGRGAHTGEPLGRRLRQLLALQEPHLPTDVPLRVTGERLTQRRRDGQGVEQQAGRRPVGALRVREHECSHRSAHRSSEEDDDESAAHGCGEQSQLHATSSDRGSGTRRWTPC